MSKINQVEVSGTTYDIEDAQAQAEITDLRADLTDMDGKIAASLITNTASGAIASFPDGADNVPVQDLVAQITPVQDLHGYDSPWPAGGGVNKLDSSQYSPNTAHETTAIGVGFSKEGDDTFVVTLTNYSGTYESPAFIGFTTTIPNYDKTELSFAWFIISDTENIMRGVRWANASNNNNIAIDLKNCTVGKSATLKLKLVVYSGSTAPTEWTPYSNICPISGWTGANVVRTGKNLLDVTDETNINTINASATFNSIVADVKWKPNTQYTLTVYSQALEEASSTKVWYARFMYADGSIDGYANTIINYNLTSSGQTMTRYAVTSQASKSVVGISFIQGKGYRVAYKDVQLEEGIATAYEPYTEQPISVSWETEAGTVYGGTLDVTTGVLTVDKAMVDLGTLTWAKGASTIGVRFYTTGMASLIKHPDSNSSPINAICSNYKRGTANESYIGINGTIADGGSMMFVVDDALADSTAETFKTAMSGVQLVYELAEPQTYQLTPQEVTTILGQNNIWADTGDTTVDYRANTKLYIENLTAPTEDDMIADHAISANSFFMVGNTLYRATTAIASGATITVGTNATKLSLSDALNALS